MSTFGGNVDLGDDDRLRISTGNDLQIYLMDLTQIEDAGTGKLQLGSDTQVEILNGSFEQRTI